MLGTLQPGALGLLNRSFSLDEKYNLFRLRFQKTRIATLLRARPSSAYNSSATHVWWAPLPEERPNEARICLLKRGKAETQPSVFTAVNSLFFEFFHAQTSSPWKLQFLRMSRQASPWKQFQITHLKIRVYFLRFTQSDWPV